MQQLTIIKIGGKLLDDPNDLNRALTAFAEIDGPKILVHGGGKKASAICRQLGIEPKMNAGRRITDAATLEVATMVYAGLINKQLVSQLQDLGSNAIGLSGADGNTILANKRIVAGSVDYGFAGDVVSVNTTQIATLLENGLTPVFCAITHDGKGQLLNTNADTIATSLATALTTTYRVSLKFCFEKPGVLADPESDDSLLLELSPQGYADHRSAGTIYEGMIPKLDNAFAARQAGVNRVVVTGLEGISTLKGTVICP